MFNILCPSCGKESSINKENGNITCACGVSVNVTELNLPEYGPYKRSKYINELSNDNSFPDKPAVYQENISYEAPKIIENTLTKDDIIRIIKQWSGSFIFNKEIFNKAVKKTDISLAYVPLYVFDIKSSARLDAVASLNEDLNESGRKILRTHYYNIEHFDEYAKTHVKSAGDAISDEILPKLLPYDFSQTYAYDSSDSKDVSDITVDKDILYKKIIADISTHMKKQLFASAGNYSSIYNYETEEFPFAANIRTVYVPLWKMEYPQKGRINTVYINGQSGKIYGSSPFSFVKAAALTALTGLIVFAAAAAVILSIL